MAKKIKAVKKIDVEHITQLVRGIKEREQVKKQLESEIKAAQDEIKQVMTDNHLEEMLADVFTVRYKPVTSSRFDTSSFKSAHENLYNMFLKEATAMKFTIS